MGASKLYMGIDPGKNGGIALIDEDCKVVDVTRMPATNADLRDTIEDMVASGACVCYLEEVHSMPKQGVVSTFTFGQMFGWVQQVVTDARLRTILVKPGVWQKALGMSGTGKDKKDHKRALKAKAQQLFPDVKVTEANQDALLLAYYSLTKEK